MSLLALLYACGGTQMHQAPAAVGDAPIPLIAMDYHHQRLFFVHASVAGRALMLMVDTGASVHTMFQRAVDTGHFAIGRTHHATGQHWAGMIQMTVPLPLGVGPGLFTPPTPLAVLPSGTPDVLPLEWVSGLVSPQRLVSEFDAVDIDLIHGRLGRVMPPAVLPLVRELRRSGSPISNCTEAEGVRPIATVTLDGEPARLLVDTGATNTVVWTDSPIGRQALQRADGYWDRALERSRLASAFPARVGGTNVQLLLEVAARRGGNACQADGILGSDVLRACRILLASFAGAVTCVSGNDPEENVRLIAGPSATAGGGPN